jgi:TRAP-type transport system periplasmic protein
VLQCCFLAGLVFNTARTQSFRDGLKSGGFYKEWRARLGDEPLAILEQYAGALG